MYERARSMLEEADVRYALIKNIPGDRTVKYKGAVNKYGSIAEIVALRDRKATSADLLAKKAYQKGNLRAYAKACAARIRHRNAAFAEAVDWSLKSKTEGEKFIDKLMRNK
jgi:hypothetical protein